MIKIDKPTLAPKKLRTDGQKEKKANCELYTRNRNAYNRGKKTFEFDSGIYGHKTVKQSLIKAQHGKCCFCESKITHISYGDVEHFRPKAGVKQRPGVPMEKPGYYWLAYKWSNLFFSCQICNQRHKKNLFPLKNPTNRARSHEDDINVEEPMFISPDDNPEQYISFREEVVFAVDDNPRGKATIKALGLDRDELNNRRREYFERSELIYIIANRKPPITESKKAKKLIAKSVQSSSKYASMIRCAVNAKFKK